MTDRTAKHVIVVDDQNRSRKFVIVKADNEITNIYERKLWHAGRPGEAWYNASFWNAKHHTVTEFVQRIIEAGEKAR